MKITKIEYSMTRQREAFHPMVFTLSADVQDGESAEDVAEALKELTIRILYRDIPPTRDAMIEKVCVKKAIIQKEPVQPKSKNIMQEESENPFA